MASTLYSLSPPLLIALWSDDAMWRMPLGEPPPPSGRWEEEGESGTLSTPRGIFVGAVAFFSSSGFYLCTPRHAPGHARRPELGLDCRRAEPASVVAYAPCRHHRMSLKVGRPTNTRRPSTPLHNLTCEFASDIVQLADT